jgi:hypothetical protein
MSVRGAESDSPDQQLQTAVCLLILADVRLLFLLALSCQHPCLQDAAVAVQNLEVKELQAQRKLWRGCLVETATLLHCKKAQEGPVASHEVEV